MEDVDQNLNPANFINTFHLRYTMSDINNTFKDFGASDIMGPALRQFVEQQLTYDLEHYKIFKKDLYFDWSDSCAEGHSTDYLDGILENFSYVSVFTKNNILIGKVGLISLTSFLRKLLTKRYLLSGTLSLYLREKRELLKKQNLEFLTIFGKDLMRLAGRFIKIIGKKKGQSTFHKDVSTKKPVMKVDF